MKKTVVFLVVIIALSVMTGMAGETRLGTYETPKDVSNAYELSLKGERARLVELGEVCNRVKGSYEKDKVPLHRMDNYWRCLQVQGLGLLKDGSYIFTRKDFGG